MGLKNDHFWRLFVMYILNAHFWRPFSMYIFDVHFWRPFLASIRLHFWRLATNDHLNVGFFFSDTVYAFTDDSDGDMYTVHFEDGDRDSMDSREFQKSYNLRKDDEQQEIVYVLSFGRRREWKFDNVR